MAAPSAPPFTADPAKDAAPSSGLAALAARLSHSGEAASLLMRSNRPYRDGPSPTDRPAAAAASPTPWMVRPATLPPAIAAAVSVSPGTPSPAAPSAAVGRLPRLTTFWAALPASALPDSHSTPRPARRSGSAAALLTVSPTTSAARPPFCRTCATAPRANEFAGLIAFPNGTSAIGLATRLTPSDRAGWMAASWPVSTLTLLADRAISSTASRRLASKFSYCVWGTKSSSYSLRH